MIVMLGAGLAVIGTVVFVILKIWLHGYGKRIRDEMKRRYG